MTTWPRDELERIGDAEELRLASRRPDGSLRPYVTMRVVRAASDLYVLVGKRFSTRNPGEITGYAVALPHDTTRGRWTSVVRRRQSSPPT